MAASRGKKTTSKKSTKPKRTSSKSPKRSRSTRRSTPAQAASVQTGISLERKIDLLGLGLALIGVLSVLSLFYSGMDGFWGQLNNALSIWFGWGKVLLPVGLIVIGIWLIARNVDYLPGISIERIIGIILLFLNLLVVFQGAALLFSGQGGGKLGELLYNALTNFLGAVGAVILIISWLLISLAMTLDLSIRELFQWTAPIMARLRESAADRKKPSSYPPIYSHESFPEEPQDNFTPLTSAIPPQHMEAPPPEVSIKTGVRNVKVVPYVLPQANRILEKGATPEINEEFVQKRARVIEETLASFGAPSQVVEISRGPSVTQFGVEPLFIESRNGRTRVRVNKIVSLSNDIALALAAPRIRIQAPVPGRSYIGIEVPNLEMDMVMLRDVVESDHFKRIRSSLKFALGKGVAGQPIVADLANMPHLLIAGTTGSGKSVCVNSILTCLLLNNTPNDLRLVLIDPKRVELTGFNDIPHLLNPVLVEMDRVVGALQWMTREMDKRYHQFAEVGARNISDYNARMAAQAGSPKMHYIIIVIDELADLMMIAPDETERTITRLAQLARATGIHLVIATQRPSVDVVTGLIKANFPARIAFAVASGIDSRVILDHPGAEQLLGKGDMLFQAPDAAAPIRIQGVFVSDAEIQRMINYWREQAGAVSTMVASTGGAVDMSSNTNIPLTQVPMFEDMSPIEKEDTLLDEAIELVRREGRASISMLQRKMRIGYTRAARMVDRMEEKGIISGPQPGSQLREVLDFGQTIPPEEDGM
ncbi:MAG TPA: DNA translocase FtsK 4TM domain-containing protein [Anaerolineales bacterium]|nr:DNA translocase FtsK 4TM domain-containing protein [Anaerolineales bacterium]